MTHTTSQHSRCPVARTMELLGEGWTLLVILEAFRGTRHFNDFERRLGAARNILSARLKKLVEFGVLSRVPSKTDRRVVEYRLTERGKAMFPMLVAMSQWASEWLLDEPAADFVTVADGTPIAPVGVTDTAGRALGPKDVRMIAARGGSDPTPEAATG